MTKSELFYVAQDLQEILGQETFISELLDALDSEQLEENLKYISRMHDLDLLDD